MSKILSQFIIVLLLCAGASWGQGPSILTTSPLTNGAVGADYFLPLAVNGCMPPYTWSVLTGTLPSGLTLSSTGSIGGVPTTGGTSVFLVEVKDGTALSDMRQFSLTIVSPFSITTSSPLPNGQLGVQYAQTLAATGAPQPYTWSVVSGALPGGLTLSLTGGTISGTPTATGTSSFTIQVVGGGASQSGPPMASQAFSLTVNPPPLAITSPPILAPSTAGLGYARSLQAVGGLPPYNWTIASGALPPGVTMNTAGMLSGTPTTAGLYSFTVQVVDNLATTFAVTASIQALINPALIIPTTSPLPAGTVGVAYSLQGAGFGGTPPVSITLTGTLPPGLALGANGTLLSGTPTTAGNYSFAIQANDSVGAVASRMFDIAINLSLAITITSPLPAGTVGVAYSQTMSSTGGALPVTWSVSAGVLPSGLTLTGGGVLSGTPAVATGSIFTVQVSDASGATVSRQLVLNIAAPLAISITTPWGEVLNQKLESARRRVLIVIDPGGKLWSRFGWCLVPVYQHDFGFRDVLIGGASALKKARRDPVGESVAFRKPSRALV